MARALWLFGLVSLFVAIAAMRPAGETRLAYAADCGSYGTQQIAQAVLRALPSDIDGLDGPDDDGIACSELPCPCDTDPVEHAVGDVPTATPTATATTTPTPTLEPSPGQATATATAQAAAAVASATATASAAAPTATVAASLASQSFITPPSTGNGGLR